MQNIELCIALLFAPEFLCVSSVNHREITCDFQNLHLPKEPSILTHQLFKKRYINSTSHEHNPKSISQLYRQYPNSFQLHMFKENRVMLCLLTLPHLLHALPLPWQRCWLSPRRSWHRGARTDLGTQRSHRKGRPWGSHGSETLLDVMGIWECPIQKHVNIYIANPKMFWGNSWFQCVWISKYRYKYDWNYF